MVADVAAVEAGNMPETMAEAPAPGAADAVASEPGLDPAARQLLDDLPAGAVVQMNIGGRERRVRLAWVSGTRRTFVFSSQEVHTHVVPALDLAEALRGGRVRIVPPAGSLFDRLLARLLR